MGKRDPRGWRRAGGISQGVYFPPGSGCMGSLFGDHLHENRYGFSLLPSEVHRITGCGYQQRIVQYVQQEDWLPSSMQKPAMHRGRPRVFPSCDPGEMVVRASFYGRVLDPEHEEATRKVDGGTTAERADRSGKTYSDWCYAQKWSKDQRSRSGLLPREIGGRRLESRSRRRRYPAFGSRSGDRCFLGREEKPLAAEVGGIAREDAARLNAAAWGIRSSRSDTRRWFKSRCSRCSARGEEDELRKLDPPTSRRAVSPGKRSYKRSYYLKLEARGKRFATSSTTSRSSEERGSEEEEKEKGERKIFGAAQACPKRSFEEKEKEEIRSGPRWDTSFIVPEQFNLSEEEKEEEDQEIQDIAGWDDSQLQQQLEIYLGGLGLREHDCGGPPSEEKQRAPGQCIGAISEPRAAAARPGFGGGCDFIPRTPYRGSESFDALCVEREESAPWSHQGAPRDVHIGTSDRCSTIGGLPVMWGHSGRQIHGVAPEPERFLLGCGSPYGDLSSRGITGCSTLGGIGDPATLEAIPESPGTGQCLRIWKRRRSKKLVWLGNRAIPFRWQLQRKRKDFQRRERKREADSEGRKCPESMGSEPREVRGEEQGCLASESACRMFQGAASLAKAVMSAPVFEDFISSEVKLEAIERCGNIQTTGAILAWMVATASLRSDVRSHQYILPEFKDEETKRTRFALPLRLGELEELLDCLRLQRIEDVSAPSFVSVHAMSCWTLLAVFGVNSMHSSCWPLPKGEWTAADRRAIVSIERRVASMMENGRGISVLQTWKEVEKEIKAKKVNYTGEEMLHCHPLTLEQVLPGLPPLGHGGCVRAIDWVGPLTKQFLLNPKLAVVKDVGQELPKLQGKIHVVPDQLEPIVTELVSRNVCGWIPLSEVLYFRGQPVLNGLFGVEKPARTSTDKCVLRLIMNLVASNSVLDQLTGGTRSLPYIGQWLSLVLEDNQQVRIWQSDMSAAFYLFEMPRCWWGNLSFNILRRGNQIGFNNSSIYALSCRVIPMGFNSSVALMQEISENLLLSQNLPKELRVSRGSPVPMWMTSLLEKGAKEKRAWYHIYLDNFCAGERIFPPDHGEQGSILHEKAEVAWRDAGVVSSEKKRKSAELTASELGSFISGTSKTIGVGIDRMLKLVHATLWLHSQKLLGRKLLQILAGRWIHVLQFRRPGMTVFDHLWKFMGGKKNKADLAEVRRELFKAMCILPLLHSDLSAGIANFCTASDASNTGGAIAISRELTPQGKSFVAASSRALEECPSVPILVVSLFNGIGGSLRCYDVLGLRPEGIIICDICKEANRISLRRWPNAELIEDIKKIDATEVSRWARSYTQVSEVHVWGGFPCSDLSSAKAFRKNLEGEKSGLFHEIPRVLKLVRKAFGSAVKIKELFENVASMDKEALEEISKILGRFPYFIDPSALTPMRRPRLCWTTEDLEGLFPDVAIFQQAAWKAIEFQKDWPETDAWVTPGWYWGGEEQGTPLPTAMRTVPKTEPPWYPAGIERCDHDCLQRWAADDFRVPPYQYKEEFLMWSLQGGRWRRPNASEKELLLGYGWQHTSLAYSASQQKQSAIKYEDCRQALLGDAFSIYAFALPCAGLCRRYLKFNSYKEICQRMGVAPGFTLAYSLKAPLCRELCFGSLECDEVQPHNLNRLLLSRVNHTGSDVRITTGLCLNPRAYPRQGHQLSGGSGLLFSRVNGWSKNILTAWSSAPSFWRWSMQSHTSRFATLDCFTSVIPMSAWVLWLKVGPAAFGSTVFWSSSMPTC